MKLSGLDLDLCIRLEPVTTSTSASSSSCTKLVVHCLAHRAPDLTRGMFCVRQLSYPVFPSPKVSDVVVEPYNAALAIHALLDIVDEVMVSAIS